MRPFSAPIWHSIDMKQSFQNENGPFLARFNGALGKVAQRHPSHRFRTTRRSLSQHHNGVGGRLGVKIVDWKISVGHNWIVVHPRWVIGELIWAGLVSWTLPYRTVTQTSEPIFLRYDSIGMFILWQTCVPHNLIIFKTVECSRVVLGTWLACSILTAANWPKPHARTNLSQFEWQKIRNSTIFSSETSH